MERKAMSGRLEDARAHPLAELLECPAEAAMLLNGSVLNLNFDPEAVVFRQSEICKGLYLVASGKFQRRSERLGARLTLSPICGGDLVELAAALGDPHHNYTLTAQPAGSVLMLPLEALVEAVQSYPPLRLRLVEELAREVCRAYMACRLNRRPLTRAGRQAGWGSKGMHLSA